MNILLGLPLILHWFYGEIVVENEEKLQMKRKIPGIFIYIQLRNGIDRPKAPEECSKMFFEPISILRLTQKVSQLMFHWFFSVTTKENFSQAFLQWKYPKKIVLIMEKRITKHEKTILELMDKKGYFNESDLTAIRWV